MPVRLLPRNLFKQCILGIKKLVSWVTASGISTQHSNRHGSAHCNLEIIQATSAQTSTEETRQTKEPKQYDSHSTRGLMKNLQIFFLR